MAENEQSEILPDHVEPIRETEDIAILLYKRSKEQEKQLAETVKRERETRNKVGKEKARFQAAKAKMSSILPKRAALTDRILLKEVKLKEVNDRILRIDRFIDDCHVFLAKGNVYEDKLRETKEKIHEVIIKEHENEQKLVIVYRRKDNLERLISRVREKNDHAKSRYQAKLAQHREAVTFQQQVRNNIKDSIERAKKAYDKSLEIAPKLLEMQRKVRLLAASIYGMEFKINAREDELKEIRKKTEQKKEEHDQLKLQKMIRLDKKMRALNFK